MSQRDYLSIMAEGRAGRRQFWSFYALMALPALGLVLTALATGRTDGTPLLILAAMAWVTLLFLPVTMLMARRFHDLGLRGRIALGQFAAVIAALAAILLYPVVYPRPSVAACVNFGMILRLDDPSGTSERRSDSEECAAARLAPRRPTFIDPLPDASDCPRHRSPVRHIWQRSRPSWPAPPNPAPIPTVPTRKR